MAGRVGLAGAHGTTSAVGLTAALLCGCLSGPRSEDVGTTSAQTVVSQLPQQQVAMGTAPSPLFTGWQPVLPPSTDDTLVLQYERRAAESDRRMVVAPRHAQRVFGVALRHTPFSVTDCEQPQWQPHGVTDERGHATLPSGASGDCVLVIADAVPLANTRSLDCPLNDCDEPVVWAALLSREGQVATLPIENQAAGAFAARDSMIQGMVTVRETARELPFTRLNVRWEPFSTTECFTSCYDISRGEPTVFVLGQRGDSDEFDHQILLHEFGHYISDQLMGWDGVGGFHDGSPTSPELAWSEGWATGFALFASGQRRYVDTDAMGGAVALYDQPTPGPGVERSLASPLSEETVAWVVLDLLTRPETDPLYNLLWDAMLLPDERVGSANEVPTAGHLAAWLRHLQEQGGPGSEAILELATSLGIPQADAPTKPEPLAPRPQESPITPGTITGISVEDGVIRADFRANTALQDVDARVYAPCAPEGGVPSASVEQAENNATFAWAPGLCVDATALAAEQVEVVARMQVVGGVSYWRSRTGGVAPDREGVNRSERRVMPGYGTVRMHSP
jgi:hypothetical protein